MLNGIGRPLAAILFVVAAFIIFAAAPDLPAIPAQLRYPPIECKGQNPPNEYCAVVDFIAVVARDTGRALKHGGEALIVLGTLALALFTFTLWRATRDLVRSAERTTETQLRAYISGKPFWIDTFSENVPVHMKYKIANHGLTPAIDVVHSAIIEVGTFPLSENHPFPTLPKPSQSKMVIFADSPIDGHAEAEETFTRDEIAAIKGGTARIFIYGQIDYSDVFKFRRRRTRFCITVLPSSNLSKIASGDSGSFHIDYQPADQHNEID
jgi:hypothetical protein